MDKRITTKFNWGIHHLKALCLFVLCLTHVYSWVCENFQIPLGITDFDLIQPYIDAFAPLFQSLAGISLFTVIYTETKGTQNAHTTSKKILEVAFLLFALEGIKFGLTEGWAHILHWGSLNTIALSMVVIAILARISMIAVFGSMILITIFFSQIKSLFQIQPIPDTEIIVELGRISFLNYIYAAILIFFYLLFLWKVHKSNMQDKFKRRGLVFLTVGVAVLLFQVMTYICDDPSVILEAKTYLKGALVGDYYGIQLFPFFAWYPKVCLGFLVYYGLGHITMSREKLIKLLSVISVVLVGGLLLVDYHKSISGHATFEARKNLSILWGGGIINDEYQNQTMLLSIIALLFGGAVFGLMEIIYKKMNVFMAKISRASLWIYLFVTGPGFHIIGRVCYYFDFKQAIYVSMLILVFLSYVIAESVHFIGQKKVLFVLKKPTKF